MDSSGKNVTSSAKSGTLFRVWNGNTEPKLVIHFKKNSHMMPIKYSVIMQQPG